MTLIDLQRRLVLMLVLMLGATNAQAQDWEWSVSPLLGVYSPQLGDLNAGEFKAPLPGKGAIIVDQEASVDYIFKIENPLPDIRFASEVGVELQLKLDEKNSLIFGLGSWEGMTTSVVQTEMPFQGELSQLVYERSGRISTTQYFLGLRRNIITQGKHRLYGRFTLNEFLDVDYIENMVFSFKSGPAAGFKRVAVMESQATGVLMLQLGLGGETYIRDWIALGFDVGYLKSLDRSTLGNASLKDDFQAGDNLDISLPAQVGADQRLWYLDGNGVDYRLLELKFDGWRALLRVNFYF